MKKRILFLSIILAILLTLCACSGENSDTNTETSTESNTNTSTQTEEKEYAFVTVEYRAENGGYIDGKALQSKKVEKGKNAAFDLVTAKANEGYEFIGWSDGKIEASRSDLVSESVAYTAKFKKLEMGVVTYKANEGGGIVGTAIQSIQVGKSTYSVKAFAYDGYKFIGWDDGVTTEERTDVVSGDITFTALFDVSIVTVEYKAEKGGTIEGELVQKIDTGSTTTTVTAVPSEGYKFVSWSDGNKSPTRQDTSEKDTAFLAVFKKYYTVQFKCDEKYGSLVGSTYQEVLEGDYSKAVSVNVNDGYDFVCWNNGSTKETLKIIPKENMVLEPYFTLPSAGLPVITIDTENGVGIDSKDVYVNCTITVHDPENGYNVIAETGRIQGRGNSTWSRFDKKPYKFKFDEGQDLFGFGKDKDWVLLADYIDNSLIRNYFAYTIAGQFSELEASPDCQSVEVYLNGEYRGVYLLCEQIEVDKHRVEICDDEALVDTGYLVEMDGWDDESQVYVPDQLNSGRKYTIKAPDSDVITAEQKAFIENYLKDCISAINGADYARVEELLDTKSFAQAYIIFDLFKNPDTNYSSLYFYKDAGGKLICGPVWDFDMSIGNVKHKGNGALGNTDTLWSKDNCPWFNALLKHDEFKALVGSELKEYVTVIESTLDGLYEYVYAHENAYLKNFEKWDVIGKDTWTNPSYIVSIKTWQDHVEYTRQYLLESLMYLQEFYPPPTE